jgi:RNA polymerase sigma-70 factor (ECF subfamily)
MNETERARLVQAAVVGDRDALQRLIMHYHGPLFGTIDGRLNARLRRFLDADDILQEAYAAAYRSIRACRFDGPAGFYKWLEAIAVNQLRNAERDHRRQKRDIARRQSAGPAATTSYPDLLDRLSAPGSTPSRHLAKKEAAAAVLTSLARLTEDQRKVIRLRILEGRPVPEVASHLGKTETAIHGLCYRGLKELRALIVPMTRSQ